MYSLELRPGAIDWVHPCHHWNRIQNFDTPFHSQLRGKKEKKSICYRGKKVETDSVEVMELAVTLGIETLAALTFVLTP